MAKLGDRSAKGSFNERADEIHRREKKEADKLFKRMASHLEKAIKEAKETGVTSYHYEAPVTESNSGYTSVFAAIAFKTFDILVGDGVSKHNAFNVLTPVEVWSLPGFLKLHEACKAANIGIQLTCDGRYDSRNGVTLHFDKPYGSYGTYEELTGQPMTEKAGKKGARQEPSGAPS